MNVIIVNGHAQSGKNTFIEYCKRYFQQNNIMSFLCCTIEPVKEIARSFFKWDGIKDDKSRILLSNIKDLWINYCDGPFNHVKDFIKLMGALQSPKSVIFVNVREPSEIEKIKNAYKDICITILIERPHNDEPKELEDKWKINSIAYDRYILNNNSLAELKTKSELFCNEVIKQLNN